MLTTIEIASVLLALPAAAAAVLAQVELWQRKEYRLDRMWPALRGPELRPRLLVYAALLLFVISGFSAVMIALAAADRAWIALRRGVLRPRSTVKAAVVVALAATLTLLAIFLSVYSAGLIKALAISNLFVPLAAALSVATANSLGAVRQRADIQRAERLRRSLPHLTVVGITGSYGKTSTKHFLAQLLPHAVASRAHRNSEFSIALDMLEQLSGKSSIYIVEMAAYRRGEIAALTRLAQPRLGVITAIGNQHLATFGSQENIIKAKLELIDALPNDGIAVLNADDEALAKFSCPQRIIWYSARRAADVYVDAITVQDRIIRCRLYVGSESQPAAIPLAGRGALYNVLAATAAAHAYGAASADIFKRVQQLKPFPRTMEIYAGISGATVIDDSYSANERGVLDAIEHLALFPQRDKRVALVPLLELGAESAPAHRRIGQALKKSIAAVYVFGRAFRRELGAHDADKIRVFTSPEAMAAALASDAGQETVILLEGRLPELVRRAVLKTG
ncbi:MAG: hypothetical protein HY372_01840 [Candidatus Andersenbacteria bacterium]|nr:hypothetical protein [Candidatus Andersenbacteria bacterium]